VLEEMPAFEFVQPAPDAVGLADPQCILEARLAHRALRTDQLRALLAFDALVLAFELGRGKEHGGVRAATGGFDLPSLRVSLHGHGAPPFPALLLPTCLSDDRGDHHR
jgi:hypothetical protein